MKSLRNQLILSLLVLSLFSCNSNNGISESSETLDSLKFENEILQKKIDSLSSNNLLLENDSILFGTTFLPYSDKMIGLLNKGLEPISFEIIGKCNDTIDITKRDYPDFKNIERVKNTLTIDVAVASNCCNNFLGEAEVINEETLNLVYTAYGSFCGCTCEYLLRYSFETSLESEYQILKFVTLNGSSTRKEIPLPK